MSITLKDVAREAGVSVATASLGLANHPRVNERTRDKIRQASLRVGYCTPVELAAKRLGNGFRFLFVGIGTQGSRHLQAGALNTLMANPAETGYRIELAAVDADQPPAHLAAEIRRLAADSHGVVLYGTVALDLLELIAQNGLPTVLIGKVAGEPVPPSVLSAASVGFDHVAMGARATRLLIAQGYRDIGLITTVDRLGLYHAGWQNGYRLALVEAGLHPLIADTWQVPPGDIPQTADGRLPDAYVIPDFSHLEGLTNELAKLGTVLTPSQVVTGGSIQHAHQLQDWACLLSDTNHLIRTALAKLVDLNTQPLISFQTISIPWTEKKLQVL